MARRLGPPKPPRVSTRIDLGGPFFEKDPAKTYDRNVLDMLDKLADWGEEAVRRDIQSHAGSMPYYTGWTANLVLGYTRSWKTGRQWETHAAVGMPRSGQSKKDAIRTMAAAASIEKRWHPFRRVASGIRRARPVLAADLTRGLD